MYKHIQILFGYLILNKPNNAIHNPFLRYIFSVQMSEGGVVAVLYVKLEDGYPSEGPPVYTLSSPSISTLQRLVPPQGPLSTPSPPPLYLLYRVQYPLRVPLSTPSPPLLYLLYRGQYPLRVLLSTPSPPPLYLLYRGQYPLWVPCLHPLLPLYIYSAEVTYPFYKIFYRFCTFSH